MSVLVRTVHTVVEYFRVEYFGEEHFRAEYFSVEYFSLNICSSPLPLCPQTVPVILCSTHLATKPQASSRMTSELLPLNASRAPAQGVDASRNKKAQSHARIQVLLVYIGSGND